jgi:hypothetical protein
MNCEQAMRLANRAAGGRSADLGSADLRSPEADGRSRDVRTAERRMAEQRLALEHIATCPDCRDVQLALAALSTERRRSLPAPPPGALHRAVHAAAAAAARAPRERTRKRRQRWGFWAGMSLGGVVAAGLAVAILALGPSAWRIGGASDSGSIAEARATPEISMALNETRDVNISVEAPAALPDAEIRVVLTGAIELAGFEGQKELRWRTDLAAGPNQLRLPIVALGGMGGQLLVEVQHGERHRTFVVDVKASDRRPTA